MSRSISLDDHLDAFVAEQVARGRYGSPEEVVAAALRLLEERERLRQAKVAEIRQSIEESRREGRTLTEEEVFGPLEARLAAMIEDAEQQGGT